MFEKAPSGNISFERAGGLLKQEQRKITWEASFRKKKSLFIVLQLPLYYCANSRKSIGESSRTTRNKLIIPLIFLE